MEELLEYSSSYKANYVKLTVTGGIGVISNGSLSVSDEQLGNAKAYFTPAPTPIRI